MIDDPELLALFRDESDEHLQRLDEGLLRLESDPRDRATLEEVFRSAHSLKGAARMLGLTSVETLSHAFEDALSPGARGVAPLTLPIIERCYQALDALRLLVREDLTGAASGVDIGRVIASLQGIESPLSAPQIAPPLLETPAIPLPAAPGFEALPAAIAFTPEIAAPDVEASIIAIAIAIAPADEAAVAYSPVAESEAAAAPIALPAAPPTAPLETPVAPPISASIALEAAIETAPTSAPAPIAESEALAMGEEAEPAAFKKIESGAAWQIETIRVPPARLDALLSMAGELIVATTRAQRGRAEFDNVFALWEEGLKLAAAKDNALRDLQRADAHASGQDASVATPAQREWRRLAERDHDRLERMGRALEKLRASYDEMNRLSAVVSEMEEAVRSVRLLPLSTLFQQFPRTVRDLAKSGGKEVQLVVEGGDTRADKRILEELKDPLMHLMRNALDHGIETPDERVQNGKSPVATLCLRALGTPTQVIVEVQDDGRGLNLQAIRASATRKNLMSGEELAALSEQQVRDLIFAPGFSTAPLITDVSGRGVGLDVVRANVEKLRGQIEVDSLPGRGCTFRLMLPVTLGTTRVLLVRGQQHIFALPVASVERIYRIAPTEIFLLRGKRTLVLEGAPVAVAALRELLVLPETNETRQDDALSCVLLSHGTERLALAVGEVLDEQEIILKPLSPLLRDVPHLQGATILDSGEVCLVLRPSDLIQKALQSPTMHLKPLDIEPAKRKAILLAEDSITTRTQEKRILEGAGYDVVTAVDGLDAWQKLASGFEGTPFDAVVSDVEMPNLDGLSLALRIRREPKYQETPIILVTSLASEDDRRRGMEVGADAYISKGAFDQKALLDALQKLV